MPQVMVAYKDNQAYAPAAALVERLRIALGKPKSAKRKALEAEPQKLPSEAEYYARLDDEKLEALNDAYYRELKGSMGVRAFWVSNDGTTFTDLKDSPEHPRLRTLSASSRYWRR